jgi:hypothetical protein
MLRNGEYAYICASTTSCESGMIGFEFCNTFHLVHVFLKNFERRGREGIFRASYSGDLGHVSRPGIRLIWPKFFSCSSTVVELQHRRPLARRTCGWKCDNKIDPEGMVCYDVTVCTVIGFGGRMYKHGNEFCISIRGGSYLSSEQILC